MENKETKCDLLVIGAGTAGFSAAVFAASKGLKTVVAGKAGETTYSSGLIDLMGADPLNDYQPCDDPFEIIDNLKKNGSKHPYAFIDNDEIVESIDVISGTLEGAGLKYIKGDKNSRIMTHMGYSKTTFCYPVTMESNPFVFSEKPSCVIIGFERLRGFSPMMIKEVSGENWRDLRTVKINLPFFDHMSSIYTETVARFLESDSNRELFAELIKPHVKGVEFAGFPAVFGINNPEKVLRDLEEKTGVKLFEIPVMPPSTSGQRLKEAHIKALNIENVTFLNGYMVEWEGAESKAHRFRVFKQNSSEAVIADNVLLATGRFIGKGLSAGRKGIVEKVFDLPVSQPENRSSWHTRNFFDPNPVNLAGLDFDHCFRPIGKDSKPIFDNLFAAGSILSGNDWKRCKSGSGVAIASAFKVANSIKIA